MAPSRRDFLKTSACALGGMALASTVENLGLIHAMAQGGTDYKALVCLFMNGGNDGNNMFIDLNQYASYSSARSASTLAIQQGSFLPVTPSSLVPCVVIA